MSRTPKPLPPGTVERMDALLGGGELDGHEQRRVLAIRLLALGAAVKEAAQAVGRSEQTVGRYKRDFLREGERSLRTDGWGGRRNEVLSVEAEQRFVQGFRDAAERGELVTAGAIRQAFVKLTGRHVHPSTIYDLLERCGWRKVVPRPTHPDADPERREAFKQTSRP